MLTPPDLTILILTPNQIEYFPVAVFLNTVQQIFPLNETEIVHGLSPFSLILLTVDGDILAHLQEF